MSLQNIYSKNISGMIDYAGNTLGLNGACSSFSSIYTGCGSPGTSGISGAWITTNTSSYANTSWHNFVNSLPSSPTNGGTTFNYANNSSSDVINIPDNYTIDYAVLIWSGNASSPSINVSTRAINFTDSNNTTHSITPQYAFVNSSTYGYYTCAKDVTDIVTNSRNGYYTVGNVYSEFRTNIACAGWLLIVVYTYPTLGFINININIGNLDVSGDSFPSATLAGFQTPSSGQINAGIILTALNGNPASAGDQVSLTNINNDETFLYGPYNPVNNFFGAQILNLDSTICTEGTFGNLNATPNSIQTTVGRRMGFDISVADASPALSHNQISTTLSGITTGNNYSITSAILLVQNKSPLFDITANSSDSTVLLGKEYTIEYTIENIGTEDTTSVDFTFNDTGLEFVSGYYTISGSTYNISSTPNSLSLPSLNVNDIITISLTYNTLQIPDNLYYDNLASLHYTFSIIDEVAENTLEKNVPVNISFVDSMNTTNLNPVSKYSPLINPGGSDISYTIVNSPENGVVNIDEGLIIYTPSTLQQATDIFVIKVTNSNNNSFINLVYNLHQFLQPSYTFALSHDDDVNLFSKIDCSITVQNTSEFEMTNIHVLPGVTVGCLMSEISMINSQGQMIDVERTANNLSLGNLEGGSSLTLIITYEALKLPTDLIYGISGSVAFYFGGVYFSRADSAVLIKPFTFDPIANFPINIYMNETYSKEIPIIEPDYPYLNYSIKTQGSLGNATVSSNGVFTYVPHYNTLGSDSVVVTINNTQQNTSLDVTYTFTIVETSSLDYIPYKLVDLLNGDIYLKSLNNIDHNVCFDCNLWLNGYTSQTSVLIIPPIKSTLTTVLSQLTSELQEILNNSLNSPCNESGFKCQVDRLLNGVNILLSKISPINCISTCNDGIWKTLLSLLSDTLNSLIIITSTLEGLTTLCNNNCTLCNESFNDLMCTFINNITEFYNLLPSWNSIAIYFINIQSTTYGKSYVASYIPSSQLITPLYTNTNNRFACPPKK